MRIAILLLAAFSMALSQSIPFPGPGAFGGGGATGGGGTAPYLQGTTYPPAGCGGNTTCSVMLPGNVTPGSTIIAILDSLTTVSSVTICGVTATLVSGVISNANAVYASQFWKVANSASGSCSIVVRSTSWYGTVSAFEVANLAGGVDGTPIGNAGPSGTSLTTGNLTTTGPNDLVLIYMNGGDSTRSVCTSPGNMVLRQVNSYSLLIGIQSAGTYAAACTASYPGAWAIRMIAIKQ